MQDISINISGKILEYNLNDQDIIAVSNYMLDRLVDEVMANWERAVDSNLHSTRGEYRKAMYSERPDDFTAIIGLSATESRLAMMLEEGASSFDMKEGFSNSSKKHMKVDGGWYLTIPMRHATSDAVIGSIVGSQLPDSLRDIAKGNNGKPVTNEQLPDKYKGVQTHSIVLNTGRLINYTHKAPIYEGLVRKNISSTGNENRGGYFTFRRVSDKSDADAFMYPGMTPKNLLNEAIQGSTQEIDKLVGSIWNDYMDLAVR